MTLRDLIAADPTLLDAGVLGTLWRTFDGAVCAHGAVVWHPDSIAAAKGIHPGHAELTHFYESESGRIMAMNDHWASVGGCEGMFDHPLDECYSTREAAERAAGAKQ